MMHYVGTGITPAMTHAAVGVGSQYAFTARDANGAWLDGGRDYTLTLPAGIPAKTFWAIDIYDPQTRSLLQTDNPYPSIHSQSEGMRFEDNGDLVIAFGPTAPAENEGNWIQTVPDKGWFPILRIYGPLEAWFDKTWRPGEIQPSRLNASAAGGRPPYRTAGNCRLDAARAFALTPPEASGTGHDRPAGSTPPRPARARSRSGHRRAKPPGRVSGARARCGRSAGSAR